MVRGQTDLEERSRALRKQPTRGVPDLRGPGHWFAEVTPPPRERLVRWGFRTLLRTRTTLRRSVRPLRWRSLRRSDLATGVSWGVYRFTFIFSKVRWLRSVHFRLRDYAGRRRHRVLPLDKLLVGGWNGISGQQFARRSGLFLDPSTRLGDSFYVDFLRQYQQAGTSALEDDAIRRTGYFQRLSVAAKLSGHYRGVSDDEDLVVVAREFTDRFAGRPVPYRPGRSTAGTLPRVRRIRHSDCYEIMDGHHRLALSLVEGATEAEVVVEFRHSETLAQDLLRDMSWLEGRPCLYQPIDLPEVATWPIMRHCEDRLGFMLDFLERRNLPGRDDPSYLDVGACYGWFVSQMGKCGYQASGIELDPLAVELSTEVFGLRPEQIVVADCAEALRQMEGRRDVVSCFSMLHHFVMGRGTCSAEELADLLDRRTGTVLFLDTGQSHESWFRWGLPEWTPDYVRGWVLRHSSFTHVEPVGIDRDGVGPFAGKFGRTLFACTR